MTRLNWLLAGLIFVLFLGGCDFGPDTTPTRVICQTASGAPLFNGVVPRDKVRPCFWDISHNATCVGDMVFNPAFPCALAPEVASPVPPVAQRPIPPSPTTTPARGKKR